MNFTKGDRVFVPRGLWDVNFREYMGIRNKKNGKTEHVFRPALTKLFHSGQNLLTSKSSF